MSFIYAIMALILVFIFESKKNKSFHEYFGANNELTSEKGFANESLS